MKYLKAEYKITDFSTPDNETYSERVGREALSAAVWAPVTAKRMDSYLKMHADWQATQKRWIMSGRIYQSVFGDTVVSFKRA